MKKEISRLLEFSDQSYYRESENTIVLPWLNGYVSGVVIRSDNTIAKFATAL